MEEQEYLEYKAKLKQAEDEQYQAQKYAEYLEKEKENKEYRNSFWTNGDYSISWLYDEVVISDNKSQRFTRMCGGDFEYALQALLAANPIKKEDLY